MFGIWGLRCYRNRIVSIFDDFGQDFCSQHCNIQLVELSILKSRAESLFVHMVLLSASRLFQVSLSLCFLLFIALFSQLFFGCYFLCFVSHFGFGSRLHFYLLALCPSVSRMIYCTSEQWENSFLINFEKYVDASVILSELYHVWWFCSHLSNVKQYWNLMPVSFVQWNAPTHHIYGNGFPKMLGDEMKQNQKNSLDLESLKFAVWSTETRKRDVSVQQRWAND